MMCRSRCVLGMLALTALAATVCCLSVASAQSVTLYSENFEGLDLGPNVDEGLNADDPRDAVWSPNGPPGWVIDRSGVPGYGTDADGVTEWAGWNFADPIWWSEVAGDQTRSMFIEGTDKVIAVADGDEWDDGYHEPGLMNTFMSTPPIPVAGLPSKTPLELLSSWRPDVSQIATITASYDGGNPIEILRYESDPASEYYWPDNQLEDVSIPLNIPAGAQNVVLKFGYTEASNNNNWWWAVDNISLGNYYEDFEGVELGTNVDEGRAKPVDNVWTKTPPAGWSVENMVPGQDEEDDLNGVTEWIGWSFTNKDWWVGVAGDQRRIEFAKGQGTVMVADPDEWDDADHPDSASEGWYNTFMKTSAITLDGVDANSVKLKFDSSWRPEYDDDYHQTGNITVSYDGGPETEVLLWESDPDSDNFKDDNSTNDTITVDLKNPAGAKSMVLKFGLYDAGNDWWWAIDNLAITGTGNVGIPGDYSKNGQLDAADLDLQAAKIGTVPPPAGYDLDADNDVDYDDRVAWLHDLKKTWVGDSNLDLVFDSNDFVQVFVAGKYESGAAAGWAEGDWDGSKVFDSGDFVAAFVDGGYEIGQRPVGAVSAVPEPSSLVLLLCGSLWLRRRRHA